MMKLVKFYTKLFVKTPIFILSLVFSMYIFIFQLKSLNLSILEYTSVISYAIIASNLFFLVAASSILSKRSEIMEFLEKNRFKRYLIIILSGAIISVITSIMPIIIIIIFKNSSIEYSFVVKGILNFFIIWNLSNIISISIGASVGILLNRWTSLFISISIYSFFPINLFSPLLESKVLNKLFNIYSDSTTIQTNILCDEIFDISYVCDKVFVLCLILLMIILVKILLDKNKKVLGGISFLLIVFFIGDIVFINNNSIRYIHEYDVSNFDNVDYHIKSYEMNMNIGDDLKNDVSFNLDVDSNIDSITFLLDDLFKIEEIRIDGEAAKFTHEDDKVVLDYKTNEKKSINIEISYEGHIHIEDELGVATFYCNSDVMNLTNSLHWYPSIYNNSSIDYDININTSANIYSNLDVESQGNNFKVTGTASEVDLFAGQYKKVDDNGIEYIIPSTYNLEEFKTKLEKRVSSYLVKHEEEFSKDDFEVLREKRYKKVIVGMHVNTNSYIKISNDTLLINYI
ncbi:hypothetical protein [Clostridium beijerinckii]|uniref:hypothetical protein n=1 Tax=Clostridium beijerinckii TaxID=1520 RepID=UPI0003D2B3CA|nr:hypothetical protein [Clostridium beijerinckii]ALB44131.1 hypothetical protein X276_02015 [Clostridium beijerinckii NRRL B-598]